MTTAYANQEWRDRVAILGDPAEEAFEEWAGPPTEDRVIQRLGFHRSALPQKGLLQLPLFIRHLPDYVMYDDGWTYLVEVGGTANPQGFKVRQTKLDALGFYAKNGGDPLFFISLSPKNSYAILRYDEVLRRAGPVDHFTDGNAFRFVPNDTWLPIQRG